MRKQRSTGSYLVSRTRESNVTLEGRNVILIVIAEDQS